jgi:hypothetical protein
MTTQAREISIPESLYLDLEARLGPHFGSVDDMICFMVRELLRSDTRTLDQAEQQMIRTRLEDLGYL